MYMSFFEVSSLRATPASEHCSSTHHSGFSIPWLRAASPILILLLRLLKVQASSHLN